MKRIYAGNPICGFTLETNETDLFRLNVTIESSEERLERWIDNLSDTSKKETTSYEILEFLCAIWPFVGYAFIKNRERDTEKELFIEFEKTKTIFKKNKYGFLTIQWNGIEKSFGRETVIFVETMKSMGDVISNIAPNEMSKQWEHLSSKTFVPPLEINEISEFSDTRARNAKFDTTTIRDMKFYENEKTWYAEAMGLNERQYKDTAIETYCRQILFGFSEIEEEPRPEEWKAEYMKDINSLELEKTCEKTRKLMNWTQEELETSALTIKNMEARKTLFYDDTTNIYKNRREYEFR